MKYLIKNLLKEIREIPFKLRSILEISKIHKIRAKFHNIMYKSKLNYNEDFKFYSLEPMPKKEFLDEYYKTAFLKIRPSQAEENYLRDRDYQHFELIQKNILSELKNKKCKILNFGSGHGGVSLLLRSNNHIIYNFEYQTPKKNLFNTDYYFINDFDQIDKDTKFDIIYSSHVLEHASDIFELLKQFKECSHENTFYFFEVPNGFNQERVLPPHTYYYTKSFFEKIFSNKKEKKYISYINKYGKIFNTEVDDSDSVIITITNNQLI
tara:strand:- start:1 stop:798 length:798 start_codon:yes stop_codon:yes gene_type:complete